MAADSSRIDPPAPWPFPRGYQWRAARLRDVPALVRLYRGISAEARRFHHPYPRDRLRLVPLFLWMVGTRRWARRLLRRVPNLTFLVFVAVPETIAAPCAYATIRFVARPGQPVWGRFGYLVADGHRGRGIGTALAIEMYRSCLELGVRRGGGTVLGDNAASRTIVERFGFHMVPSAEPDRRAPGGVATLEGIEDLDEVLRRALEFQRQRQAPGTVRSG